MSCCPDRQNWRPGLPVCYRPGRNQDAFRKIGCSAKRANRPVNRPFPAKSRTTTLGPFGEVIRSTGPMAKVNPIRFSTKFQDDESDLLYYGYRYYKPSTGTWVNRDPVDEAGFKSISKAKAIKQGSDIVIYGFVGNNPIGLVDWMGLACCCKCPVIFVYISVDPAGIPTSFNAATVGSTLQSQLRANVFDSLLCGQTFRVIVHPEGSAPTLGWSPNGCIYVNRVDWTLTVGIASSAGGKTAINTAEVDAETSSAPTTQTWVNILAHEVIWLNAGGHWDSWFAPHGEIASGQAFPFSPYTVLPASRSTLRGNFPLCK